MTFLDTLMFLVYIVNYVLTATSFGAYVYMYNRIVIALEGLA